LLGDASRNPARLLDSVKHLQLARMQKVRLGGRHPGGNGTRPGVAGTRPGNSSAERPANSETGHWGIFARNPRCRVSGTAKKFKFEPKILFQGGRRRARGPNREGNRHLPKVPGCPRATLCQPQVPRGEHPHPSQLGRWRDAFRHAEPMAAPGRYA